MDRRCIDEFLEGLEVVERRAYEALLGRRDPTPMEKRLITNVVLNLAPNPDPSKAENPIEEIGFAAIETVLRKAVEVGGPAVKKRYKKWAAETEPGLRPMITAPRAKGEGR